MNLKLTIRAKITDCHRGISDIKKGYQHKTNLVEDEKGDLVADSHSILARWRNHFSKLLNIFGVNNIRHTEIPTAQPLMPKQSAFEFEMAIEKLKKTQITRYLSNPGRMD
jgi:hypothetical protein